MKKSIIKRIKGGLKLSPTITCVILTGAGVLATLGTGITCAVYDHKMYDIRESYEPGIEEIITKKQDEIKELFNEDEITQNEYLKQSSELASKDYKQSLIDDILKDDENYQSLKKILGTMSKAAISMAVITASAFSTLVIFSRTFDKLEDSGQEDIKDAKVVKKNEEIEEELSKYKEEVI